ncbi:hypothetical protein M409DRAFT_54142 [Zasmidium cellare ATCC 36951]|uniref:Prion-inhibition and propagation HeLo domain-containing protein n=1 Tax=Zasmidium cellare ATCC 36951 TaxID=1080233 RepID=A0A6A6CK63_ZASCE|nr:uncharacterized protein M409DRAFT_54142 [Zasmidium cellare ATCC 36951]KAF2167545.1 hypothetical protein M409DRAFT_54142 [Zasmidium cellare ATCC 36951]
MELFYSCLVLVIALRAQSFYRAASSDTNRGWHRFLNDLCWVCDTQPGGKSVVSLAVDHNSGTRKIWLASNSKSRQQLKSLKWTLGELQRIRNLKQKDLANAKSDFLAEVLKRSYSKVKFYKRQLEIALDETTTQTCDEGVFKHLLRDIMRAIIAYQWPRTLSEKTPTTPSSGSLRKSPHHPASNGPESGIILGVWAHGAKQLSALFVRHRRKNTSSSWTRSNGTLYRQSSQRHHVSLADRIYHTSITYDVHFRISTKAGSTTHSHGVPKAIGSDPRSSRAPQRRD